MLSLCPKFHQSVDVLTYAVRNDVTLHLMTSERLALIVNWLKWGLAITTFLLSPVWFLSADVFVNPVPANPLNPQIQGQVQMLLGMRSSFHNLVALKVILWLSLSLSLFYNPFGIAIWSMPQYFTIMLNAHWILICPCINKNVK